MIRANVLAEFAERFAAAGFDAKAFVPSYGLAEATLAVTFAPLARGLSVDVVDRGRTLEVDRRAVPADGNGRSRGRPQLRHVRPPDARLRRRDPRFAEPAAARAFDRPGLHPWPEPDVGLLPQRRGDPRRAAGERLARYRRSRLPGRRPAGDHRPQQGPDHRRRPQHLAAGPGMGGRASGGRARRATSPPSPSTATTTASASWPWCNAGLTAGAAQEQLRGGGGGGRAAGRRRRMRGGAGTDPLADLHHLGQAQPGRGQGRLSWRRHPRHRGWRRGIGRTPSASGSPSPAEAFRSPIPIARMRDGRRHRSHRLRRTSCLRPCCGSGGCAVRALVRRDDAELGQARL